MTNTEVSGLDPELAAALATFRANTRVRRITIAVSPDTCGSGREIHGTYQKEMTPRIPVEACSRPGGCTCRYLPVLEEIFP